MTNEIPSEEVVRSNVMAAKKVVHDLGVHINRMERKLNHLKDKLDSIEGVLPIVTTSAQMIAFSVPDAASATAQVGWPVLQSYAAARSTVDSFNGTGEVPLLSISAQMSARTAQDEVDATASVGFSGITATMAAASVAESFTGTATLSATAVTGVTVRRDFFNGQATNNEVLDGVGLANPSVGFNFGGVSYWQSAHPFLNIVKSARRWTAHSRPYEWSPMPDSEVDSRLDAQGYPTSMPPGADRISMVVMQDQPADPKMSGRFVARWTGTPNMAINGTRITSGNSHTFSINAGGAISLDLFAPGIKDLSIVAERHLTAYNNGEIFNPDYLDIIRDFRTIRFMNWQAINGLNNEGNQITRWDQRIRPDHYIWTGYQGIPPEIMVALANRIGADPWFCMPHLVNEDYVRRFATLVRNQLDPRLVAFIEDSNEVWNIAMFGQAQWFRARALERWPSATWEWMQHYGEHAANMFKIWREVFAGQEHRIQCALSSQTGQLDFMADAMDAPMAVAETGDHPPSYYSDVFAVTAYFGYGLGSNDNAQELIDLYNNSGEAAALNRAFQLLQSEVNGMQSRFATYRDMIQQRGLKMVMYEGGSHAAASGSWTNNATLTNLLAKVARDSRMGPLYTQVLNAWKNVGGQAFCLFTDVEEGTKYGSWGHLERLSDSTPRMSAVQAWNVANPGYWETRDPAAFYDH